MQTKQQRIENNFKIMLRNKPNKICPTAIDIILNQFEAANIDTKLMRKWAEDKMNQPGVEIYELSTTKKYVNNG